MFLIQYKQNYSETKLSAIHSRKHRIMYNGIDSFPQPKDPKEKQELKKSLRRHNDELNNPCVKEQKLVFSCLDANSYDHNKCGMHVENYKICKKFWGKVRAERRKLNILPHLPAPEERDKVKAEYAHLLK